VTALSLDDLQAHAKLMLSELSGPQLSALRRLTQQDFADLLDPALTHDQVMLIVEGKRRAEAPADVSSWDTFLSVFQSVVAVANGVAGFVIPVASSVAAVAGAISAVKST